MLTTFEASACPTCTNERMLVEYWHIKYVLISLVIPMFVVANRLDLVGCALVLIPYVALSFEFHHYLCWRALRLNFLLAQLGWWTWALNLVGLALLYGVSRFTFFRWQQDKGLAVWQPVAYVVAMFIAHIMIR